jgi:hypothetical protein
MQGGSPLLPRLPGDLLEQQQQQQQQQCLPPAGHRVLHACREQFFILLWQQLLFCLSFC